MAFQRIMQVEVIQEVFMKLDLLNLVSSHLYLKVSSHLYLKCTIEQVKKLSQSSFIRWLVRPYPIHDTCYYKTSLETTSMRLPSLCRERVEDFGCSDPSYIMEAIKGLTKLYLLNSLQLMSPSMKLRKTCRDSKPISNIPFFPTYLKLWSLSIICVELVRKIVEICH